MAAVTISKVNIPITGMNLSDSGSFTALASGSGNGVKFNYNPNHVLVLLNDTGSSVTFTLKLRTISKLSSYSITPTNPQITVANTKIYLVKLGELLKDAAGQVTVECSGAGKAMLVGP